LSTLLALVAGVVGLTPTAQAAEGGADHPAAAALEEVKGKPPQIPVIQNRFFLKGNRFEIAPVLGYVPNNAFVSVPLGGAFAAYHFSEALAVEGAFYYAPNTGAAGVKNLTKTLVTIAYEGNQESTFRQPLDRPQLGIVFDARWAPVYGKINLIGEGVLNFDVYGTAGVGLLTVAKDYATINEAWVDGEVGASPVTLQAKPDTVANFVIPSLGVGLNFFLSQSIALKIDARSMLYVAEEPDYGNEDAAGNPVPLDKRLYNTFITTAGVSIFVPKMKPRLYNF
jgi:outer membrane beta-barrel protein